MLELRGRETESSWTSGEIMEGTLGNPDVRNFVFDVESFQSLGRAHRGMSYVRLLAASRCICFSESRQIGFHEICANSQSWKQWTKYDNIVNCICLCGTFPCIVNFLKHVCSSRFLQTMFLDQRIRFYPEMRHDYSLFLHSILQSKPGFVCENLDRWRRRLWYRP